MFGASFGELTLIGVIALVVLGPERLPAAARNAGLWAGRLKRLVSNVKLEIEKEVGASDIRSQLQIEDVKQIEAEAFRKLGIAAPSEGNHVSQQKVVQPTSNPAHEMTHSNTINNQVATRQD